MAKPARMTVRLLERTVALEGEVRQLKAALSDVRGKLRDAKKTLAKRRAARREASFGPAITFLKEVAARCETHSEYSERVKVASYTRAIQTLREHIKNAHR